MDARDTLPRGENGRRDKIVETKKKSYLWRMEDERSEGITPVVRGTLPRDIDREI